METLLIIIHVFVSMILVVTVLLQAGRGGGMGATFGGASQQMFGGRGAGGFLAKVTTGVAIVFFLTSLSLSMISSRERSAVEKALESKQVTETQPTGEGAAAPDAAAEAPAPEQGAAPAEQPAETPTGDAQQPAQPPAAAPAAPAAPAPAAPAPATPPAPSAP